jgi:nitroimidazol reductase NimA-like FMN-containing flavoprotein (pyridoxamine 5'-phosphate oxidase superfamily)
MADLKRIVFRDLSANECRAVLAKNRVGRLAFTFHERVDIEPINYVVVDDETLAFRVVPGSRVDVLRHHPWVAFEVNELIGLEEWKSVVVHGAAYAVTDSGTAQERASYARVAKAMRYQLPAETHDADPLAERPIVLSLHIDALRGRLAKSSSNREAS